jgi:sigma-B regulation protein RsbU (phosphoserine phosphatase)
MAAVGTQLGRIVERVRSETARFNSVIDNMPANVRLRNKDGRFILVNRNYENFYGITNDSVRGKKPVEVQGNTAFNQLAKEFAAVDREAIETNTVIERDYEIKSADGFRILTDRTFPIIDSSGEVIAVGGVEIDITERKRTEEALAEKEAQLRLALDHMPGGMFVLDRDFNYVLVNSRHRELLEFPDGLIKVGGAFRDALRYQADRGDFGPGEKDDLIERVVATYQRGEAVSYERAIAGSGRTLQIYGAPVPQGGYVVILTDITERKRTEADLAEKSAMLEVTMEHMDQGISMFDGDLKLTAFNHRFIDLLQFPSDLVHRGTSLAELFRYNAERSEYGPGDPEEQVAERIALARKFQAHHFERTRPDGMVIEIRGKPTTGSGMVTTYSDITKRKLAEDELRNQKERMEDELNIGREIQMSMIPLVFPPFPDHDEFSVFAALEPAREVGGDFYDYYFIDEERFCFCIGDVSGKGVPAALFMAMAKTLIKSRAADDRSTASILTHVNDELSVDNSSCMFVTIFSGILNIRTGELLYTNAGHNPPYLKRKDGTLQLLDQRHGPVIGAVEGMVYGEGRDTLEPGDLLLLYTDGVTEAMDVEERLFSEDRLEQLLTSMDTDDPDEVIENTVAAVKTFEGEAEQADDITVLALAFHGSPENALVAERQIAIKNHLPEIATVNEKFEEFAEEFGVPLPIVMKFSLMFDDLLNNVISYAYKDDRDHEIEVRMELAGGRLIVTIADDGVPFNPLSVMAPRTDLALEDREVGGLGIHLVRNLVDEVSYQRRIDRNVLTLMSHLQFKESAA